MTAPAQVDKPVLGRRTAEAELLASLRDRVLSTIAPLLANTSRIALVDFPNFANVGDSAIWLGQLACLDVLDARRPSYTCDIATYDRAALARAVGDGSILISGGGNFGDLWAPHQVLRERVLADFPRNRVIQLPQTMHFIGRAALARARHACRRHSRFTLLVRDEPSLELAREQLDVDARLCPDMAFCLGPLEPPAPPTRDVVWLRRLDQESVIHRRTTPHGVVAQSEAPVMIQAIDWLIDRDSRLYRMNRWLGGQLMSRVRARRWIRGPLSATYAPLARERLRRGLAALGAGRFVVTDRLHGHILCLLLGIPHALLDNSYGKVRAFHRQWTSGSALAVWCESEREASDAARA